jgi:hypothetical protein
VEKLDHIVVSYFLQVVLSIVSVGQEPGYVHQGEVIGNQDQE